MSIHDDAEREGHRHARLERVIFDELEEILRDEATDPALGAVRLTHATLSVDYRSVRVYYTSSDRRAAERGFARAAGFLRARLADAIDLKRVPELHFVYDAFAPASA